MSALNYKNELREAIHNLLWRQWSSLGVAGYAGETAQGYVLDPEALLIFSSRFCTREDRLYDAVIQWLRVRGGLINVSRLKALERQSVWQAPSLLAEIAAEVATFGDKRWRNVADSLTKNTYAESGERLLSAAESGAQAPQRVKGNTRKVARRLPQAIASALLTLRAKVGVTARAEVLLLLMLSPYCSAVELTARSGYSRSSLHELMKEMMSGDAVEQEKEMQNGLCFMLRDAALWRSLLHLPENAVFPHWQKLYDAIGLLWGTLTSPRLQGLSERTVEAELSRVYKSSVRRLLMLSYFNLPTADVSPEAFLAHLRGL